MSTNQLGDWNPALENKWDKMVAIGLLVVMTALFALAVYHMSHFAITAITYTEEKRATAECYKWALHAKEFSAFYLTEAQQAQCDHYAINIWEQ